MAETVVISGGTKGLGRALSLAFGHAGYRVRAIYRSDAAAARELTTEFEAQAIQGECVCCDITGTNLDADALAGGAARLVLINNAWPQYEPKPLHLTPLTDYAEGFSAGVNGTIGLTRTLLPRMVAARSGTVVNVLTAGLVGPAPKGFAPYLTAKHALVGFGCAVAAEYAALGVRVFGVCPPFMDTPRTRDWNERIRSAIQAASGGGTDVRTVASAILARAQDPGTAGKGELYAVP